ncbi:hypothetical protein [Xanthomonas virus PB119]|nr:hypothetical protein [Xanthomonas virus PB119]
MSSTVRQHGFIAVLVRPIPEEDREELSEKLYEAKSHLDFNGAGDLVFFDANRHETYDVREDIYGLFFGHDVSHRTAMEAELLKHNIMIMGYTMRPFNCIYYNGADSPLWGLTKEEFLRKTEQN